MGIKKRWKGWLKTQSVSGQWLLWRLWLPVQIELVCLSLSRPRIVCIQAKDWIKTHSVFCKRQPNLLGITFVLLCDSEITVENVHYVLSVWKKTSLAPKKMSLGRIGWNEGKNIKGASLSSIFNYHDTLNCFINTVDIAIRSLVNKRCHPTSKLVWVDACRISLPLQCSSFSKICLSLIEKLLIIWKWKQPKRKL